MTVTNTLDVLRGFARRQWAILLVATIVAGLVGYIVAGDIPDRHTALVTVEVDSSALTRFTGLTGPERLLASTLSEEFTEKTARQVGLTAEELQSGLRLYTAGVPVSFFVEFTSADRAEAERVAAEVATSVVEWQENLSSVDLDKQRLVVEYSRQTLAALEDTLLDSEWERTDLEYKLWSIRRDLTTNEAILVSMEEAYSVLGEPTITTTSGTRERLTAALGAALVGLFLGVVVAAIRDRRMRLPA